MKVTKVSKLHEKYDQYDISTETENFYVKTNTGYILIHNSPAVYCGIDPLDGKFFVAKKGLFAKNPQMYKTQADINKLLSGELRDKFTIALKEFSKLGIRSGVIQGDMMFTKSDLKKQRINGEEFITFHPNTIVYAIPAKSSLAKKILQANIGVVWHTSYEGKSISEMRATFGRKITPKLKKISTVWMQDASYTDVSGTANFTEQETQRFNFILTNIGRSFQRMNGDAFREITNDNEVKQRLLTFMNTYIRSERDFPASNVMAKELFDYLNEWYMKEISKKKTEKGRQNWIDKRDQFIEKVSKNLDQIVAMFDLMKLLVEAKGMIINQLNKTQDLKTFLKTQNGFEITNQEGFVAMDRLGKNAVKLVDRLEFSRANFSPEILKGWTK